MRRFEMTTKDAILAAIDEQAIHYVALWFTDITGVVKSVTIPASKIGGVIDHGLHFDGSSIEAFARVAESDMVLRPDLSTFSVLPWAGEERIARMICSVYTLQDDPFIGDPRNVLLKVLRDADDMGYTFKTGMELEFFLFQRGEHSVLAPLKPYDDASYFDMANDGWTGIRRRMISMLIAQGITVDSAHHEIGAGQYEFDFDYDHALVSADAVLTARVALKTVAQQHGLHCTFMPRPDANLPGSGMHTHQSLHDKHSDENVFVDAAHEYGLSETARFFLAGQLYHARAMCAVLAPLINSYKRLTVSFEAPKYVTWAHVNRAGAAMIRVPHIAQGNEQHTRLEIRCPDPSSNPYLAAAVMLAAGLNGIRQRLSLSDALEESLVARERARQRQVEMLPSSLEEALDVLEQDDVILSALGAYVSDRYIAAKRQEVSEYNRQVTTWEIERYINRF